MLKGLHNHWTKKGGRLFPKRAFGSEAEAKEFMNGNGVERAIFNAYKCSLCGKWHIGHKNK